METLRATGGMVDPKLVGVNKASTFWGFCQHHDTTTFAPLETRRFDPDLQQCFLLAYRPLVKELYLKHSLKTSLEIIRDADQGRPVAEQMRIQETADAFGTGIEVSIRDLDDHKRRFDADLLANDFKHIRATVFRLDRVPDMMCSGVIQPEFDFSGRQLQDLGNTTTRMDMLGCSLVSTETTGATVFVWRDDSSQTCEPFVESLIGLPREQQPHAIVRFVFAAFENVFMAPHWWEGLSMREQQGLRQRMMAGMPSAPVTSRTLQDDGIRVVSWMVTDVIAIGGAA